MVYLLTILIFAVLGFVLPVLAMSGTFVLLGSSLGWQHVVLLCPVFLICVNAPFYAAGLTGLLPLKQAIAMNVFSVAFLGIATLINGGNFAEGYALTMIVVTLVVVILVARIAWLGDRSQETSMEIPMHQSRADDQHVDPGGDVSSAFTFPAIFSLPTIESKDLRLPNLG